MAGVRSRHDPFVMWLVQRLVDHRVMETTVNPIYQEIGKENKDRELQIVVAWERLLVQSVVELGIAFDFESEKAGGEEGHARHRRLCLLDLHPHLVLEVFRVIEGRLVKHEDVRKSGADKV